MKISDEGLEKLIKHFEGVSLKAYPDPGSGGGPWTIGYGHTRGVKPEDICTELEACQFLLSDVQSFERAVEKMVNVPLTQFQFDALVSFAFNVGSANLKNSTLLKKLNQGDYVEASKEFDKWKFASGKALKGLLLRRNAESEWFLRS